MTYFAPQCHRVSLLWPRQLRLSDGASPLSHRAPLVSVLSDRHLEDLILPNELLDLGEMDRWRRVGARGNLGSESLECLGEDGECSPDRVLAIGYNDGFHALSVQYLHQDTWKEEHCVPVRPVPSPPSRLYEWKI